MIINGTDIRAWQAKQSTVRFGQASYANASFWKGGAAIPTLFAGVHGFKTITITLIVKGNGRDAILKNVSDIVATCRDVVTILFDSLILNGSLNHRFTGYLTSASNDELAIRQFHKLTLQFSGYEHSEQIEKSGTSSIEIFNPGNLPSPARVAITPTANASSITLTGISRDPYTDEDETVTVNSLTSGKLVVLNGINGEITEAPGNPKDVDIWHLPTLKPGWNTIECNNANMNLNIRLIPIYA